jgi:CRP/FNR family transcriptional regulator
MPESHLQTDQSCLVCISRAGGIFRDLDQARLIQLQQIRQIKTRPAGTVIFAEGDLPQGIYCICSGYVKLSISTSAGQTAIVDVAGPGDILGLRALLSGKPHALTAEALEEARFGFIQKDGFLDFLSRNVDVSLRLAQKLAAQLYQAYQEMSDIGLKRSDERLVELLLRLSQSYGEETPEGIQLRIKLSQEELAEMIGTSRRNLSRSLTKLKRLGIIATHRRALIILDNAALEKRPPLGNLL